MGDKVVTPDSRLMRLSRSAMEGDSSWRGEVNWHACKSAWRADSGCKENYHGIDDRSTEDDTD